MAHLLTLHVAFNFPPEMTVSNIEESLTKVMGDSMSAAITMPTTKEGAHRSFAFCSFESCEDAASTRERLNGSTISIDNDTESILTIEFSQPKTKAKKKKKETAREGGNDLRIRSQRSASKPKHPTWKNRATSSNGTNKF